MVAHILDPNSGMALSAEHTRIAELIKEYEPSLELAWVPPENRTLNEEFPFAVIHRVQGVEPYVVMRLRENEVDHRVLARLYAADNSRGNVLSDIELEEKARRQVAARKAEEELAEAHEMAAWAIRSKAGSKHNGVRYI